MKHVPVRRCTVCGTRAPQRELVRLVRPPEGDILVGVTRKQSGRGAYLCHNPACWQKALRGSRLADALRTELTAEDRLRVTAYAEVLQKGPVSTGPSR